MVLTEERLSARILIVDDEAANVLLLEKTLAQEGYTSVRSTTDPREANRIFVEFKPQLILLDLNMPHLNGFQVMKQLAETDDSSYLPILVLTAQPQDEIRLQALNSGAQDFLAKPINFIEMLTRIKNMIEVRILHEKVQGQNEILEQKVKERTKDLVRTQKEIIRRLGRAAEYRDNETGAHVVRMSMFSEIIARKAGLSNEDCEMIMNASPMHDVGKIGIPDNILLKPAKLDAEEWKVMKSHSAIGANILSKSESPVMVMAERIALTHHEQWCGKGYPQGLAGEEIPIEGRIVTIADVFDALTSERPYKEAWPIEDAVQEIENNSGIIFDPDLVALFKLVLPELITIKNALKDDTCVEQYSLENYPL